ncbi:MAG: [NiFe]-hydrogenase assembly chaperone HybE [Pseudomonadota bacterium]|jgi:[NiFe] hydrogenase assembly HybE family chaperone
MPELAAVVSALAAHFRHVHVTQMQDVPILNPQLQVEAVGFQTLPDHAGLVGVLITPWFMNLLWIADTAETFVSGNTRLLSLPSGEYALNANHAAAVGTFYSTSLFSPVLQFADHATAVLTAQHIMLAVMDAGTQQAHNTATTLPAKPAVSRRDFLRGKFA